MATVDTAQICTFCGRGIRGCQPFWKVQRKCCPDCTHGWCSQCGEYLTAWACGPTHALMRAEAGLEWDGVEP